MNENNTTTTTDTNKLITTINEFIPTFFSPNGILEQNKDKQELSLNEIFGQSELFCFNGRI